LFQHMAAVVRPAAVDMSQGKENNRFLLCRIGSRIGALALEDVRETMRPLPIEPLMGAPPFVLGLAIIRGFPTPVVDAGSLMGPSTSPSPILSPSPARFVSLNLGERTAALAVDAVLDVRSLPAETLSSIPSLLLGGGAQLVSVIGALDAKLLLVLEAARLVPDSVWLAVKTQGASS
jgi:purine-binding chemotaxis protein CheW